MRAKLATFRYPVEVGDVRGERFESFDLWVDTGSLYSQLPSSLLERLGYRADASRRFRLADGSSIDSPIGDVRIRIGAEVRTVTCIFGEEEGEMLLGATTLENFGLGVDPVNETLIPIVAMRL